MLFHTWTFFLFFALIYPVYLAVKGTRYRVPWLLCVSYLFYGWWNPLYLLLIFYASLVDYLAVMGMARSRRRGVWLALSVVNNLTLLGFFKYAGFVTNSLNALFARLGIDYALPVPDVLLPVGISFFVFQSMSYTIDFYRGEVEKESNFLRYATFVSLFPQLVAGPIERARNLLPQLKRTPRITASDAADGLSLFVVGLFKKVALADYLALYVDKVYATPDRFEAPALILATFAFAWQIYFDFSGYTDMARGVGRLLGIRLMLNFNNPYLATGLGDFWRRWHISLSTWFKDYVYIPLGGNRRGVFSTYRNMALTMLISGLWHGASWTFVAWGAVHAAGRVATRRLESTAWYRERVPVPVKRVLVFLFVTFAWIFFRSESFEDAWTVLGKTTAFAFSDPRFPLLALFLIFCVWFYQLLFESPARRILRWTPVRIALVVFMIFYLGVAGGTGEQAFIYFQF